MKFFFFLVQINKKDNSGIQPLRLISQRERAPSMIVSYEGLHFKFIKLLHFSSSLLWLYIKWLSIIFTSKNVLLLFFFPENSFVSYRQWNVGQDLVVDCIVRKWEICVTGTKMTSTFVYSIEKINNWPSLQTTGLTL